MSERRNISIATLFVLLVLMSSCTSANQAAKKGQDSSGSRVAKDDVSKPAETAKPTAKNVEIVNKGFTQLKPDSIGNSYVSYGAIIKNPNASDIATSVDVNISFYDASGTVVKTETDTVSVILPGQSAAIGDSAGAQGAVRMEVQALVGSWEDASGVVGQFTAEGINTRSEKYGGMKTNATLASTFAKDLKTVEAVAIYYSGDGIIGGDFTFVDFVPAGGKVGIEISGSHTLQGVVRTEIYAYLTSLSLLGD